MRLKTTPARLRAGSKLAKPCTRAAALRAMARASTTNRTGSPSHLAIWAVDPASLAPS